MHYKQTGRDTRQGVCSVSAVKTGCRTAVKQKTLQLQSERIEDAVTAP